MSRANSARRNHIIDTHHNAALPSACPPPLLPAKLLRSQVLHRGSSPRNLRRKYIASAERHEETAREQKSVDMSDRDDREARKKYRVKQRARDDVYGFRFRKGALKPRREARSKISRTKTNLGNFFCRIIIVSSSRKTTPARKKTT